MGKPVAAIALVLLAFCIPARGASGAELVLADKLNFLVAAYPQSIAGYKGNQLLMKDGGKPIIIDDGKVRDHFQKLEEGDIEDSLSQAYEAGPCPIKPQVNSDPGRIRSEALLKRLYGKSSKEVSSQLVPIKWFGDTLRVTPQQGVDKALEAVRDDLATHPELIAYLAPSAGVFNWRKVSGAANLSVHSFGAAIDLNTKFADYWVWAGGKPGHVPRYQNRYPMDIIEIFERHGFIWGGRWYHYDTMHFEYRPELIAIGRAMGVAACR